MHERARRHHPGADPDLQRSTSLAVLKIGGSVLTGAEAYHRAAGFLADRLNTRPHERLVVVVSAEKGATDELLRAAQDYTPEPDPRTLDLLWSTGEMRSVALLGLALQARGIRAAGLNVHQTGVVASGTDPGTVRLRALRLRGLLAAHHVVVVPGFLARGDGDSIVSLGRGGSDLSAVILAAALGAVRCELIKDVHGYYDADPNRHSGARHFASLDSAAALEMADAGCELVQKRALAVARQHGVSIVVRSWDSHLGTILRHGHAAEARP
jgi:aspartate kinase